MKQDEIIHLIASARARHLWLRSNDDKDVWLTPSEAEGIGADLWASPVYLLGFTLADPHLLLDEAEARKSQAEADYSEIQARIAAG